jgi:hypothetical protein
MARGFKVRLIEGNPGDLNDFFEMMNVAVDKRAGHMTDSPASLNFQFPNVWSRIPQNLYFLASLVNHTQFNYLGQEGDFYPIRVLFLGFIRRNEPGYSPFRGLPYRIGVRNRQPGLPKSINSFIFG